jgi:hypothetical protein
MTKQRPDIDILRVIVEADRATAVCRIGVIEFPVELPATKYGLVFQIITAAVVEEVEQNVYPGGTSGG